MYYLKLFYAIFIGALMTVATRFGPSLTIFAFVYLSRYSNSFEYSAPMTAKQWVTYYLPVVSLLAGFSVYLIRLILRKYSSALDHKILPFVDFLILRHVEKWNLSRVSVRGQSVLALRIAQILFLLLLLSLVVTVISLAMGVLAFLMILFSGTLALVVIRKPVTTSNFGIKTAALENVIEQSMMTVMVIGCVIFVPRDQWLHAAIGLFVLARFIASYRLLGKTILLWAVTRQTKPVQSRPLPVKKAVKPLPAKPPKPTAAPAPKPD